VTLRERSPRGTGGIASWIGPTRGAKSPSKHRFRRRITQAQLAPIETSAPITSTASTPRPLQDHPPARAQAPGPRLSCGDRRACRVRLPSSGVYHRERPDLIILAVTSQARPAAGIGEAAITKWEEAGLLRPSVFKPVLATIEHSLVLRKLGRLEEEDRRALRALLREILGG
jgi:mRNA interferase MazF